MKSGVGTAESSGEELGFELNDEIIMEINNLAHDLILIDFRDVTNLPHLK